MAEKATFGAMDYLKLFVIALVLLSTWFLLIYPALQNIIQENYTVAFIVWTLLYTAIVWYLAKNITNQSSLPSSILNSAKFFFILLIILFSYDLIQFPYLLTMNGVLEGLPAGARISSDVFIYQLLPTMPEFLKYWIIYALIPSISFTVVAMLAGKKKVFNHIMAGGAG